MKTLTVKERGLFPTYFKKIGIVTVALGIIAPIIIKLSFTQIETHKDLIKLLGMNVVILGLFFIAWSRDKIEDEMTLHIRFKAMVNAFIRGVIVIILQPLVDFVISAPIVEMSSQQLIASMLLFFIITYAIKKGSN